MGVLGIFLVVFGYVIYKAMTHDPEKLAEERFDEYWNEIEKEQAEQREADEQRKGADE